MTLVHAKNSLAEVTQELQNMQQQRNQAQLDSNHNQFDQI